MVECVIIKSPISSVSWMVGFVALLLLLCSLQTRPFKQVNLYISAFVGTFILPLACSFHKPLVGIPKPRCSCAVTVSSQLVCTTL